jgi:hypothetical protein
VLTALFILTDQRIQFAAQANVSGIGGCAACASIRTHGVGLLVEGDRKMGA